MSPEGEARTGWAQQNALLGPSVRPPPLRAQSCRADRPSKAAYFRVPAGHEAQPIGVRASSPRSQALNFVSWDLSSGALPQPAAPPSPLHSPTGGCRGLTLAQNPSPPFPAGSPQAISFPPRGFQAGWPSPEQLPGQLRSGHEQGTCALACVCDKTHSEPGQVEISLLQASLRGGVTQGPFVPLVHLPNLCGPAPHPHTPRSADPSPTHPSERKITGSFYRSAEATSENYYCFNYLLSPYKTGRL